MKYIVLDMEWNRPTHRKSMRRDGIALSGDIIQIGAVKTDENLQAIDTFSILVKPTYYTKMNKDVSELTGITKDMLDEAKSFPEAMEEFLTWAGDDSDLLTWSGNDIEMLWRNMYFYDMDFERVPGCYDMQIMFDDQVTDEGRDFALSYAIWKLGIKPRIAHDALNDALNTLEVIRRLDFSEGYMQYAV